MTDHKKHPGGRPTDYSEEKLRIAIDYAENFKEAYDDAIPSIAGLACALGVAKSTVYLWKGEYPEFSDALNRISTAQERHTLNGGVTGVFNPTISKLILHNHGYSESSVIEQTTTHKMEDSLAERLTGGSKR